MGIKIRRSDYDALDAEGQSLLRHDVESGGEGVDAPPVDTPCIIPWRFSITNIQGRAQLTAAPVARYERIVADEEFGPAEPPFGEVRTLQPPNAPASI